MVTTAEGHGWPAVTLMMTVRATRPATLESLFATVPNYSRDRMVSMKTIVLTALAIGVTLTVIGGVVAIVAFVKAIRSKPKDED